MPDGSFPGMGERLDTPAGRAATFIREHLSEPLTLDILAEQADLSPYHFTRVFKNRPATHLTNILFYAASIMQSIFQKLCSSRKRNRVEGRLPY